MKNKALILVLSLLGLTAQAQGLKDAVGKYFLIGTAINVQQSHDDDSLTNEDIKKHFNAIVAENCMKSENIQPEEGKFFWTDADRFVAYGKKYHLSMTGHCLIWHSQAPKWFFTGKDGKLVSRQEMIRRMTIHIKTVMSRYKGMIKGWDVVNEAFNDDGTMRPSLFYQIIGPDYIEIAFKTAHQADPKAELYYNDYSMASQKKRDAVCALVKTLKNKGCRIDAVGMQSHNGMNYPDLNEYEKSIDAFAACGVKVMMTELDLNVLPNPESFSGANVSDRYKYDKAFNPYADGMPDSIARQVSKRYLDLFNIYYRHRKQISRVTLWGISDKNSWLNDWPIQGRTNYPLLFDRQYKEKETVNEIINLFNH